ncbi:hypothetical protein ACM55K_09720 [Flavobacterium sp. LT1R49]|uniref:hypothetical protein n=1 Tax=Flavobacterium arabinosi TaxID=3398737 RepID=UPI003A8C777A
MKKIILSFVFLTTCLLSLPVFSQIENEPVALGLPGDNLNLYAVLDIFQKSKTLEEFERAINSKDRNINNLDLNNDNLIDYIRVVSYRDGDSYSIVLRVAINRSEDQDVAVIEVNKNRYGKIVVQIIGDEELYGEDYIVEPNSENTFGTLNPGYAGNERVFSDTYWNGVFYVNDWPIIINLFSPSFVIYTSPWYWGYYPYYWRPWTPIYYYNYWGYHSYYYRNPFYRRTGYVRYPLSYSYYSSRRTSSPIVRRNRINDTYRRTYEGRTFRRPETPVLPRTREAIPRTRQGNSPGTRPGQINEPRTRQSMPRTRQENAPGNHQPIPRNRQENAPANRSVQPTAPRNYQPMERDRQENTPANRQSMPRRDNPNRSGDRR